MFIEIDRKEVLSVALWRFPRLKNASDRQRTAWKQFHDGLRWEVIDEDISLESLRWADDDPQTLRWIKI
jgi:hypothetical protein